ncbi:RND transporter MFP subunit [Bacteroidia bacterium]|nr:RND transporter MFP subunit [Bacteroidia bacterium]
MTITQKQLISGNLYPIKEIEVKSAIPGILEMYYVQVGNRIRKGDQIAKIKILSEPSQIENAKMNLKTSAITFEKDQLNHERDKKLYDKGIMSQSEFEESSKIYRISKEQYEYAQNQLHLLEDGYIPESNISNVVVATSDGVLIDLPLEEGTPVVERNNFRDGTTIAMIARLDSFLFKGRIIENDVLALKKGMKLIIMPTSMGDFQTKATIRKISPKGYWDQGTMKYDIEAVFTLPDSVHIYSGFNATAEFIINEKKDVLAIPEVCLIFQNDSTFVNVLQDREFKQRWVETGISDGINIEITKGISIGNKISRSE